jgi:arylsulfatase
MRARPTPAPCARPATADASAWSRRPSRIGERGAEGVIATQGGRVGGWGLYFIGGRLTFHYNVAGIRHFAVSGESTPPSGAHVIDLEFRYDGGGTGQGGLLTIAVDNAPIAEGRLDCTIPYRFSLDETMDFGEDTGTPVSRDYDVPFTFTGTLNRVVIRLGGEITVTSDEARALEPGRDVVAVSR